mmetsp:Transcript_93688/g.262091  ORF Transcript_93688/g.262091 Transcript_93688/m.262091 type:complete len:250 (-) Transcript_93688:526-1275(-)
MLAKFWNATVSVTNQRIPSANNIPRYGGKPVVIFSMGTMRMHATPKSSTATLPRVTSDGALSQWPTDTTSSSASAASRLLATARASHQSPAKGSMVTTNDGRNSHAMVCATVIFSANHSIVVVTSPMGLQAPPALAAMTKKPPMLWRSSLSWRTECRNNFKQTMVAVRLSMTALKKKHRMPRIGISNSLRPPAILAMHMVTTAKPSKWSIDSTTPIAGSKNKMIAPTSFKPRLNSCSNSSWPSTDSCGW